MGDVDDLRGSGFGNQASPYASFIAERNFQRRIQLLAKNVPVLAETPNVLWEFASDYSFDDDSMMRAAIGAIGEIGIGQQISYLQGLSPLQQRSEFNQLSSEMRKALEGAGYSPPAEPSSGNGIPGTSWVKRLINVFPGDPAGDGNIGLPSLGGVGEVVTSAAQGFGSALGFSVEQVLNFGNSAARQVNHVYRYSSALVDQGQPWTIWSSEVWRQTSDGEEYVHRDYIRRASELLGERMTIGQFYKPFGGSLQTTQGQIWLARKLNGGHNLVEIAKDAGYVEGSPEYVEFINQAYELQGDEKFIEARQILDDGKSSPGRDFFRGFSPDMPGYGWLTDQSRSGLGSINIPLVNISIGDVLSGTFDAAWSWYSDPIERGAMGLKAFRALRVGASLNDVTKASRISEAMRTGSETYEFGGEVRKIGMADRHFVNQVDRSNQLIADAFSQWDERRITFNAQRMTIDDFRMRVDELNDIINKPETIPDQLREKQRLASDIGLERVVDAEIKRAQRELDILMGDAKDVDSAYELITKTEITEADMNRPIATLLRARPAMSTTFDAMLKFHRDPNQIDLSDIDGVWDFWKTSEAREMVFRNPLMSRANPDKVTLPSLTRLEALTTRGRVTAFEGGKVGLLGERRFLTPKDLLATVEEIEKTTIEYMRKVVDLRAEGLYQQADVVAKEFRDLAGTWHSRERRRGGFRALRGFLRHQPRRGTMALNGQDSITEANRVFDLAYALDVPENVIDEFRSAFAVGSVAERNVIMTRFFTLMVGIGGLSVGEDAAKLFEDFVKKARQAYAIPEGDDAFEIVKGLKSKAAFIPTETDDVIMLPDIREFLMMTNQTSLIRQLSGIVTSSMLDNAMRKFWIPAQLMRIGFIPRAAGEELISYVLRRSPKDYIASHLALRATGLKQTTRLELADDVDNLGAAKLLGGKGELRKVTVEINDRTRELTLMKPITGFTHWIKEYRGLSDYGQRTKAVSRLKDKGLNVENIRKVEPLKYNQMVEREMARYAVEMQNTRRGRLINSIDDFAWMLSNRAANGLHRVAESSRFLDSKTINRFFLESSNDMRFRAARMMLLNPMGQRAFARMAADSWGPLRDLDGLEGAIMTTRSYTSTGEMVEMPMRLDVSNYGMVSIGQDGNFEYDPVRWQWGMASLMQRYATDPFAKAGLEVLTRYVGDGVLAELDDYATTWGLNLLDDAVMPGATSEQIGAWAQSHDALMSERTRLSKRDGSLVTKIRDIQDGPRLIGGRRHQSYSSFKAHFESLMSSFDFDDIVGDSGEWSRAQRRAYDKADYVTFAKMRGASDENALKFQEVMDTIDPLDVDLEVGVNADEIWSQVVSRGQIRDLSSEEVARLESLTDELLDVRRLMDETDFQIDESLSSLEGLRQAAIPVESRMDPADFVREARRNYEGLDTEIKDRLEKYLMSHDREHLLAAYDMMTPGQRRFYTPLLKRDSYSSRLLSFFVGDHIKSTDLITNKMDLQAQMESAIFDAMFAPGMTENRSRMMRFLKDEEGAKIAYPPQPGRTRVFVPAVHPDVLDRLQAVIESSGSQGFANFVRESARLLPMEVRDDFVNWASSFMGTGGRGSELQKTLLRQIESSRNGEIFNLTAFATTNPRNARLVSRAIHKVLGDQVEDLAGGFKPRENYARIGFIDLDESYIKDPGIRSAVTLPHNALLQEAGWVPLNETLTHKVTGIGTTDEVTLAKIQNVKSGETRWVDASREIPELRARTKERAAAIQAEMDSVNRGLSDAETQLKAWREEMANTSDPDVIMAIEQAIEESMTTTIPELRQRLTQLESDLENVGGATLIDALGDSINVLEEVVASGMTEEAAALLNATRIRQNIEEILTTFNNPRVAADDALTEQLVLLLNLNDPLKLYRGNAFNGSHLSNTPLSQMKQDVYSPKLVTQEETSWSRFVRHYFDGGVSPAIEGIIRHPFFVDMLSKALKDGEWIYDNYARSLDNIIVGPDNAKTSLRSWMNSFRTKTRLSTESMDDLTEFAWQHADLPDEAIDPSDSLVRLAKALKRDAVDLDQQVAMQALKEAEDALSAHVGREITMTMDDFKNLRQYVKIDANAKAQWIDASMQRATNLVTPFIDDHRIRSQWQTHVSTMVPFWFAEEQFLKRWARGFYETPSMLRRGQLYVHGMREMGVIQEDENGNEMFVYPGSQYVMGAIGGSVGMVFGDEWRTVLSNPLQSNVQYMLPGISEEAGRFQFGPLVALPVGFLGNIFPEFAGPAQNLLGDIGVSRLGGGAEGGMSYVDAIYDNIMPAFLRNAIDVVGNNRESMASATLQAMQLLDAEGFTPSQTDPEAQKEYIDRVRNIARIIALTRTVTGFTLGSAATPRLGEAIELKEELQELLDTGIPFDEAVALFLKTNPDATAFTVFRSKSESGAPIPATEEVFQWMDGNREFAQTYRMLSPWMAPQGQSDKFGMRERRARNQALAYGFRVNKSDNEILRQFYWAEAAEEYFAVNEEYEGRIIMARDSGDTNMARLLEDQRSIWKDAFLKQHPTFADDLASGNGKRRRDQIIREARLVLADRESIPEFGHKEEFITLLEMMVSWKDEMELISEIDSSVADSYRDQLNTRFYNLTRALANEYPSLQSFWNSQIRPLIGTENILEMELTGRIS